MWDYELRVLVREICLEDVDWLFQPASGSATIPKTASTVKDSGKAHDIGPVRCIKLVGATARHAAHASAERAERGAVDDRRQWVAVLGQHRTLLLDLDAMIMLELTAFVPPGGKKGVAHPTTCVVVAGQGPGQTYLACAVEYTVQLLDTQTWMLVAMLDDPRNRKEVRAA